MQEIPVSRLHELAGSSAHGVDYPHWDQLRQWAPPDGLGSEQWWLMVRMTRDRRRVDVPAMRRAFRRLFHYADVPEMRTKLERLDSRARANGAALDALHSASSPRAWLDEALASSSAMGAEPVPREDALALIAGEREPARSVERRALNVWRALSLAKAWSAPERPLTLDDLQTLHGVLLEGLDTDAGGRLRCVTSRVEMLDDEGLLWHTPPSGEGIEPRMARLLEFAQGEDGAAHHPLVHAILLHYWVSFEQPFADGNGRLARVLFYWCLLRRDHQLAERVAISTALRRDIAGFRMAFAYTLTDEFDLTYFLQHQLDAVHAGLMA